MPGLSRPQETYSFAQALMDNPPRTSSSTSWRDRVTKGSDGLKRRHAGGFGAKAQKKEGSHSSHHKNGGRHNNAAAAQPRRPTSRTFPWATFTIPVSLWLDKACYKGQSADAFKDHLTYHGDFMKTGELVQSIPQFPNPPLYFNARCFRKGSSPLWESDGNRNGGKWLIVSNKTQSMRTYLAILNHFAQAKFQHNNVMTGVVLSIRPRCDLLSLWTGDLGDSAHVVEETIHELGRLTNIPSIKYVRHHDSQVKSAKSKELRAERAMAAAAKTDTSSSDHTDGETTTTTTSMEGSSLVSSASASSLPALSTSESCSSLSSMDNDAECDEEEREVTDGNTTSTTNDIGEEEEEKEEEYSLAVAALPSVAPFQSHSRALRPCLNESLSEEQTRPASKAQLSTLSRVVFLLTLVMMLLTLTVAQ